MPILSLSWKAGATSLVLAVLFTSFIFPQLSSADKKIIDKRRQQEWADSIFKALTPDERLGQLFMVAAYSNQTETQYANLENLVRKYNLGGLIFFQGGPVREAQLTNRYQQAAKVPLMIGIDGEWGLGMRLDSTISFPRQMTLGAVQDNMWVYKMGTEVARQCKRMGIHVNFAPVVDVNSNPMNPVIGFRSFGENKENVAKKGIAYMKGMQDNGILTTAKHFPGHGDTDVDSHYGLPVISHTKERLQNIELYPFRQLIADSVSGVMVSHLQVLAYDKTKNYPATLSKPILTDLLRKEMGFKGLIFTDALNMKGVSSLYQPGDIDMMALLAGNDILLFSVNVPDGLAKIKKAIKEKKIRQKDVDEKVKKILRAKYTVGLHNYKPVEISHLVSDLNTPEANLLKQQLYEQAVTLVKNRQNLIPFQALDTTTFASVSIGAEKGNEFQEMLGSYAPFRHFAAPMNSPDSTFNTIAGQLGKSEVVVIGLHGMTNSTGKGFGVSQKAKEFIAQLSRRTKVVVCVFGNAYSLKYFENADYLLCAYEDLPETRRIIPQVLFGGLTATGKLPVSTGNTLKSGIGMNTPFLHRFNFSEPESVGMSSGFLTEIDSLLHRSIRDSVFPGCQVVVAKNGTVVYQKSFGHLAYDSSQAVDNQTLYDLASITKVAATLQATMFLYERGLLDVNEKISKYLPELRKTKKENVLVRDVLMHQAGLVPYLEHWRRTVRKGEANGHYLNESFYNTEKNRDFPLPVARNIFTINTLPDSLWKWTIQTDMLRHPRGGYRYVYSDLDFYVMKEICERLLNQPLNVFMEQNFYRSLGLPTMRFNPLQAFAEKKIAPTENEKAFRRQQIQGTVHDPGAAMMGGVSGHAGLFSNALDLATLMQMNLWQGSYGNRRYFQTTTLPIFIKNYNKGNRRGLGWDKPEPAGSSNRDGNYSYVSDFCSRNSFGHSGFTGTVVWADPDEQLVIVFLSNRVCPSAENSKITRQATRRRVQDLVYKSIINYQSQVVARK
jgi:beta-N-acetylhexosaminidase